MGFLSLHVAAKLEGGSSGAGLSFAGLGAPMALAAASAAALTSSARRSSGSEGPIIPNPTGGARRNGSRRRSFRPILSELGPATMLLVPRLLLTAPERRLADP